MVMKLNFVLLLVFFTFIFGLQNIFEQRYFGKNQNVEVKTRKLFSKHNLPFEFYSLKFCRPKKRVMATENLGELLFGDRIENSLYKVCLFILTHFRLKCLKLLHANY